MRNTLLAALALALAVAHAAVAHGPPDPMDKDVRLLQDWNEDCGGDNGAAAGGCKGSMDLLGLDVQEAYDADLGDTVIFRLYADKGQAGAHKAVISLETPTGAKTFTYQTNDDKTFTNGGGFERVGAARPLAGEATRFSVDGTVRLSALGMVGEAITKFRVDSYAGANVGDFMPGGCNNTVGACIDTGQSSDHYVAGGGQGSYRLRGPAQYVRFDVPAGVQELRNGTEEFVELQITNLLGDEAQRVTVTVEAAPGILASFHNPRDHAAAGHSQVSRIDLPKKAQTMLHLALTGTQSGSGTLKLTLTTDLGGHVVKEVRYQVTDGSAPTSQPSCMDMAHCPTTKTSPSTPLLALAALALALGSRNLMARRS